MKKISTLLFWQIASLVVCVVLIIIVLLSPSFFEFKWNQALRDLMPGAEYFFRYVTEFGGTLTYLAIFFAIFWGIDKNIGKLLISIYVFGSTINYYAKGIIGFPRPPESRWMLIGASHLSTPSGHAMSSSIYWGYLGMRWKRALMWGLSILVIILVGLSRMYLGVHWFGDILTGWLFGIATLLLVYIFEKPLNALFSRIKKLYVYLGVAVIGVLLTVLTQAFYPLAAVSDFGSDGGKIIGLGLGLALEHAFVNFKVDATPGKRWNTVLRVMIGMILFVLLFLVMHLVLDTSLFYMEALQFVITYVYGIFLWPLIFKKINL